MIVILVDSFQHTIHLLLEKQLQLFYHHVINRAAFHEVGDQALYSVAVINDDSLQTEIGYVNINKQFGLSFFPA